MRNANNPSSECCFDISDHVPPAAAVIKPTTLATNVLNDK
jgi:hypothetical protein